MKTNRFENTIRRKLESIEPDFQEQDWAKMQSYMKAHTPPTFLQQYGSWLGYAAAASITTVMAFLYTGQLSQNDRLVSDVRNLKSQIDVIRNQPAITKTDTIYVVQTRPEAEYVSQRSDGLPVSVLPKRRVTDRRQIIKSDERIAMQSGTRLINGQDRLRNNEPIDRAGSEIGDNQNYQVAGNVAANSFVRNELGEFAFISPTVSESLVDRKMMFTLAGRLSGKQVRRDLNRPNIQIAQVTNTLKTEKTTRAENVIPKFNIKAPYRFGGGIQYERTGQAKTVVGEVLLARKKLSISTGLSWLKVKPMEFLSDKIFKDKTRKDFRKAHPGEVPYALEVLNIKVNPSIVQIPLTVAFRNNLKDNWAYSLGVGTNISLSSKEEISFDCRVPKGEYFSKAFDKKTDIPALNSVNFSMGIEKTWYPIVVQAEGYLHTYFKPLTPLSNATGPGVKFKLMYQIGGKM